VRKAVWQMVVSIPSKAAIVNVASDGGKPIVTAMLLLGDAQTSWPHNVPNGIVIRWVFLEM
jgi:hypothetical protein